MSDASNDWPKAQLLVASTWYGDPIGPEEQVRILLTHAAQHLRIDVDAPYYGDPAPAGSPGSCDGLWEFEVVEVFVKGPGTRYLELEMGPHGHFLALSFSAQRQEIGRGYDLCYQVDLTEGRWSGQLMVPDHLLPSPPWEVNAYAIHGGRERRRYLAAFPGEGRPDFHQLKWFRPVVL